MDDFIMQPEFHVLEEDLLCRWIELALKYCVKIDGSEITVMNGRQNCD